MSRPVLRTARIELRPMTPEHLPLLHALDTDADVMRYLTGRARTAAEIEEFWGPRCADTTADSAGLGWWVGFGGEEFLGWWDLSPGGDSGATSAEIGWRVRSAYWRRGLASEGAAALLDHGFGSVGLRSVWAETMAVNTASRGVMRRLGMRHVRTDHRAWEHPLPGAEHGEVIYEISADDWQRRTTGR